MQFLKADAAATVLIGPFVDFEDGVTPETGVTLAAADSAEIMKHDGTTFVDIAGAGANQCTLTSKEKGMYTLLIPAAVLNIEGRLTVFISDESVCLPVWAEFMVVNDNVFKSLFEVAASDYLKVDMMQVEGDDATDTVALVGAGAVSDTFTIDDGSDPVAGVDVWVSTDEAGSNVVAGVLVTNSSGVVTFSLDIATGYWVHVQLAGYTFSAYPKEFDVAAGGFSWA